MPELTTQLSAVRWIYGMILLLSSFVLAIFIWRVWRKTGVFPLTLFKYPNPGELLRIGVLITFIGFYFLGTLRPDLFPFRPIWQPTALSLTLGTAIIVSGISFYYACVATLGESFRIGGDPGANPRLITHGVYSRIRHPIYTSIQWELFGAALVYPCAFTVAAIPVALIGATLQARREERWWLAHDAQAYEAYIARTGRFLPKTR